METELCSFEEIWLELFGRSSLSAFGFTRVEVIRKKMSNRA